jgi:beta-glucosidase
VAQVYLTPPTFEGAPQIALRGFQRLSLKKGETKSVSFALSPRDLSFVTKDGVRQVIPGNYKLSVGSGQPIGNTAGVSGSYSVAKRVTLPK